MAGATRAAFVTCALVMVVGAAEGRKEGELSFRIHDETAPAGSLVQMKVMTTEVTPISGGRPLVAFDPSFFGGFAGIGMFAPGGELAGLAVRDGTRLTITYVSTTPFSGGDYPILATTLRLRDDVAAGASAQVRLEPASIWILGGATVRSKEATAMVTAGGSLAITDVVPGEGLFPAGTVVSVRGAGFDGDSRLRFNGNRVDGAQVVGSSEIQFTLAEAINLAGAQVRVDNSASESVTYYSYLRGTRAETSQRPLLALAEPIFSGVARSRATFGPMPAMNPAFQYAALALQNPGLGPADVSLELLAANGTLLQTSMRTLDSGSRLTLELSELLAGAAAPPGSSVRVTSSSPVETFGLIVDERIRSVTLRLPPEPAP